MRPRAILSLAVIQGIRLGCWNTQLIPRKSHCMMISEGLIKPAITCSNVLLPQPEGPIKARVSPA
ncbi:hypothetical protein D9M68_766370 [compost metagenome]